MKRLPVANRSSASSNSARASTPSKSRPPEALLAALLAPMALPGETLSFDLSNYSSTVTREMLQTRLRKTRDAFGLGPEATPANISGDQTTLLVSAPALMAANAEVRGRLEKGAAETIIYLRRMRSSRRAFEKAAKQFERYLAVEKIPPATALLTLVEASACYQAIGALKFCLPKELHSRLASWFDEDGLLEALLSSESPSLWWQITGRELALAALRLRSNADVYRRALIRYQRTFGYLYAEDVNFQAYEDLQAIDDRVGRLLAEGPRALRDSQKRLHTSLAKDRARKARARTTFAHRLPAEATSDGAKLIAHVLLARATAAHEDQNRRNKMRMLRDLRDLSNSVRLRIEHVSLIELAAACSRKATDECSAF